jgi:hypothetical protein
LRVTIDPSGEIGRIKEKLTSMGQHRERILHRLIRFQPTRAEMMSEVKALPWDAERELVELKGADAIAVLQRYLAGDLDRTDLEVWADLIEGREDIELERGHNDVLRDIIYELANPAIMPELTGAKADAWVRRLRE